MSDVAVTDRFGSWTRAAIITAARSFAVDLQASGLDDPPALDRASTGLASGPRLVLLCEPGSRFLTALFATWEAGCVAVPLHPKHPVAELTALARDGGAAMIVCSESHRGVAEHLAGRLGEASGSPVEVKAVDEHLRNVTITPQAPLTLDALGAATVDRAAMMVFTSGTTGRPKGVLHSFGGIRAQIEALLGPWGWTRSDRALLVLPLHHVHGIMAVVLCAWSARATCVVPEVADPLTIWEQLGSGGITVLMAVPTIYHRLITSWESADEPTRRRWSDGAAGARLMVSGSAALPVTVLERWRALSGHTLLERYGMTEFGLALSNALDARVPGHVGEPLPTYEVRIVDEQGAQLPSTSGEPGELQVRGPAMFREYWNRPEDTTNAFTPDGWFRTGDVAAHDPDGYRLLGRSSVDIIKSGGEKVSAVEIEETYRSHPDIADCAVVGIPDDEWGQRVAMVATLRPGPHRQHLDRGALRAWGHERLAPAKVPVEFMVVDELPRNAMGKVLKARVTELLDHLPTSTPSGNAGVRG